MCAVTDTGSNTRAHGESRAQRTLLVSKARSRQPGQKDGFGSIPELHSLLLNCRTISETVHYRASKLEGIANSELNAEIQSLVSTAEALEYD